MASPLALLLLASLARAGEPACPIGAMYAKASPECALLLKLKDTTRALAKAAKLDADRYALSDEVIEQKDYNAFFYGSTKNRKPGIYVTTAFVSCHLDKEEAAMTVLAHEMGHAVQHWRGVALDYADVERARSNEAQADQIGWDLMEKTSLVSKVAYAEDDLIRCFGRAEWLSHHTHPAEAMRWVQAMRHYERPSSQVARGTIRRSDSLIKVADPGPIAGTPGSPAEDWRNLDRQGRPITAVSHAVVKDEYAQLAGDARGRVKLAEDVLWEVPEEYRPYFTPAEIVAFATREQVKPRSIQEGLDRGLAYLKDSGDWWRLPGTVVAGGKAFNLPSDPPAPKIPTLKDKGSGGD